MKVNRLSISLFLFMFLLSGCDDDFLTVNSPSALNPDNVFSTTDGAVQAINGAYAPLQGQYNGGYTRVAEAGSDDMNINNTFGLTLNSWSATADDAAGGNLDDVWQGFYQGIFRANLVLQRVAEMENIEESLRVRILGEAHFLRALYYWHLTTVFGEIPLIEVADPDDPANGAVGKNSVDEIFNFMINDLQQAIDMLPVKTAYGSSDVGRAAKGAAQALLGKVHLYNENYELAEQYFDEVLQSGDYELVEDFNALWRVDHNEESIFEIQYDIAVRNDEGSSRANWSLPNGFGGQANYLPLESSLEPFEDHDGETAINGKDPRLFYSIFQQGDPFDADFPEYQESWQPEPGLAIKKGVWPLENRTFDLASSRNSVLIRLGDVILMAAEAANENNNPAKAIGLLNQIRDRVGMPNYPTADYPVQNKEEIFEAIVHERRVELMFENHRIHDLRRWGLAEEYLGPYGYQSPRDRYFPIPQAEVDANPALGN